MPKPVRPFPLISYYWEPSIGFRWKVEGDDLAKVNAFLKETCKKVFGILPGADAGGYSLTGEAKEAALSRFALPENRKAALDVIRKLNESRDSNENAL